MLSESKQNTVVPGEYESKSRLIRENLHQFFCDLKLRFDIDLISIRAFERRQRFLFLQRFSDASGLGFINDVRQVWPHLEVYVDDELIECGTSFFRQTVIDSLELYSTILASLEAANVGGGAGEGDDWIKNIEMFVLLPKIIAVVEDFVFYFHEP
ncbi:hypothetical protein L6452_31185 [Arctium lappa]|uniref:Uncharacterized protein n=1 Tax=Arctium lappa TaxID=4217 RepID=A0ACB8ZLD0_ARCLA|nr:hypothetical protein L6452_31185 [Arctium lappa]